MKNKTAALLALIFATGLTACTSASKSDENVGDGTDLVASNSLPSDTDAAAIQAPVADIAPPIEAPIQEATDAVQQTVAEKKEEVAQDVVAPVQDAAQTVADTVAPPPAVEPEPAPQRRRTGEQGAGTYRVQKGDTLMKIAYEKYGDLYQWRKILELNGDVVGEMKKLSEGTILKLDSSSLVENNERNGERYLIKMGDTLGSISDDVYGTNRKWRKIWQNNKPLIKDPNRIYAGFFLYYLMNEQDRIELTKYRQEKNGEEPTPRAPASK